MLEAIRNAKTFLLALHLSPDGDSVGASLAFRLALAQLGKKAVVASKDPLGDSFGFLPGAPEIVPWDQIGGPYDVVLLFDCADRSRMGSPLPIESYGAKVVNVDHHSTNSAYGDAAFIDPSAAAVAEIALRLIDELGVVLEPAIALCLYVAIVTDTGSFQYSSTSPQTHRIAARLLDAGLDAGDVSEEIYERNNPRGLSLLAAALESLEVAPNGQVAVVTLRLEDMERTGGTAADCDSLAIVNYARSIRGVEVGVLFREEEEGIKVSLRSRGGIDVGALALRLGGGGHERAAGIFLRRRTMAEARQSVLTALGTEL